MKKVLVFIGSPRKGETYQAVTRFEETLKKIEDVQMEYIMLSKMEFKDCVGCHNCVIKGAETCREAHKVAELKGKMLSADAVILATPVYNQNVTALMKKFLDYFTFLWHRPEMFGIKFFGISSGGGMFKDVFKVLKSNAQSWGGTWIGELGVAHYEALTPKYKQKLDEAYIKKAHQFTKAIQDKKPAVPSIGQLMMFNIWKINAKVCKEAIPLDFTYWKEKDLFDKSYYYPVKIGFEKRVLVRFITGMARHFMRKVYVGY